MKTSAQVNAPRYNRERWEAAQASWKAGEPWSKEWREWRHLAANSGIPEAPNGTEWDSWLDDSPSQRAMLIRAIRETPTLLRRAITAPRTHSWAAVIEVLLHGRDAMLDDADEREERGSRHDPPPKEAGQLLRRIDMITDEADGPRVLASIRAGRCPTCGGPFPRDKTEGDN